MQIKNRQARRALEKADRCLERATFVPAGIRAKLRPEVLKVFADKHGVTMAPTGKVTRCSPAS